MRTDRITIAIRGNPVWCHNLKEQLLKADMDAFSLRKTPANPIKYIAWLPYFYYSLKFNILHVMSPPSSMKTLRLAKRFQTKVICHWIGSDVLKLNVAHKKAAFLKVCPDNAKHIVVAAHLCQELAVHNINVTAVIPNITNTVNQQISPLPEKPSVLSYWSEKRAEFFGAHLVFDLATAFPDIPFRILGNYGEGVDAPSNVEFLGYQEDVAPYIRSATCYIRIVPHDGEPMMIAECLAMGRYVIYNHRKPYCEYATDFGKMRDALVATLRRKEPNYCGAEYVQEFLNPEKNIDKLSELYRACLAE